eukprot:3632164-Pleurochrysis_carterae.AAC.2
MRTLDARSFASASLCPASEDCGKQDGTVPPGRGTEGKSLRARKRGWRCARVEEGYLKDTSRHVA